MSVIIDKQLSYFFDSSPTSGAEQVSVNGNEFSVSLNSPIKIPKTAVCCEIGIAQASIWNTSSNIAADFNNNTFTFTTTDVGAPGTHTIVLPDGLYSLDGLNASLNTQFTNLGLSSGLISLTGDQATQNTVLTFQKAGDSVDFTVANSIREVLGFDSRISPLTPQSAGYSDYSDSSAQFNRNNSYILRSNIVSHGIPVNNQGNGIIASIPITSAPGSQIHYQPQHIIWADASDLIGSAKSNLRFTLLNQSLLPVHTSGDAFSFVLIIKYQVLLTQHSIPMTPHNSNH